MSSKSSRGVRSFFTVFCVTGIGASTEVILGEVKVDTEEGDGEAMKEKEDDGTGPVCADGGFGTETTPMTPFPLPSGWDDKSTC
mmetsp:Transcript_26630/g.73489  ORF Transcript_26630/g.73489 Transcript_26630/m.73489 type:complete len:84 (+) Transcript_26630:1793-2044(+)